MSLAETLNRRMGPRSFDDAPAVLGRLLERPQRHRLLHGYPLAAAMPVRVPGANVPDVAPWPEVSRGLLIGVLPHPFCNPAVTGCGFCTFPHEVFSARKGAASVADVVREIERRLEERPDLKERAVTGLYFGGGTANLTPAEPFRTLCRTLASRFDLSGAEVTLEGVPAYFLNRRPRLIDILLEEIPARHVRLSMGIQTFDRDQLARMGRLGFGTTETFREVVDLAHSRGLTISADLLFNLPGQTLDQMRDDLARADALGLDHLGLYHLVLFEGLGTAWSRDPELLAALPSNERAAENWQDLRGRALALGFDQTTLTNFERQEFRGSDRRFVYEECSFRPDRFDMLGFGPSGISFGADRSVRVALKTLNPSGASDYASALGRVGRVWDRSFWYDERDLRVLTLTRRLSALRIERPRYRDLFGTDPLDDFALEFQALADSGLVEIGESEIHPTPRGMFFADAIAGLLAWRRSRSRRPGVGDPDGVRPHSAAGHMG